MMRAPYLFWVLLVLAAGLVIATVVVALTPMAAAPPLRDPDAIHDAENELAWREEETRGDGWTVALVTLGVGNLFALGVAAGGAFFMHQARRRMQ